MIKPRALFFYTLYTIILFAVFAWVFFPERRGAVLLANQISSRHPGVKTRLSRLTPVFPVGLKAADAEVFLDEHVKVLIDALVFMPDIASLFLEKKGGEFTAESCRGTLKTDRMAVDFALDLNGDFKMQPSASQLRKERWRIAVTDLRASVNEPVLNGVGISGLRLSRADVVFTIDKETVEVLECTATGNVGNVDLSGMIHLRSPVEKSVLDLKAAVNFKGAFLSQLAGSSSVSLILKGAESGGVEIHISGTLERPEVRL